ncbi:MAG: CDP-glucose 4,6-dehydratase [Flavobacteriales bacterium]|nr:CDP-glucose 4,6-dehydratase [Crocinitomicaceae bacterium]NBX79158.1 CDP-glucose 4,6-dehydratase [Flavobacteriales bacterium]NCA21864.1 CDP-glucose 4,6-dehydratase [Crocinitomicaceae bacterium]
MKAFFKNKKILITGHTGFKGSWLSTWLLMLEADVHGFSKNVSSSNSMYNKVGLENEINSNFGDILDLNALTQVVNLVKPDIIFHLAAQPIVSIGYADPVSTFNTNIIGTVNILEALRKLDNSCVLVNITSDKCYSNKEWVWGYRENDDLGGADPYSASKSGAEIIFNSYFRSYFSLNDSKKVASARAGNVIGGGDWGINRLIPDCIRSWDTKNEIKIKNPLSVRPWQHVLDAIYGYLLLAQNLSIEKANNGEAFNFGQTASESVNVNCLVDLLAKEYHKRGSEAQYIIENEQNFVEFQRLNLNCDKAYSQLGWRPRIDINKAIYLTAEWYIQNKQDNTKLLTLTQKQILDFQNQISN